MDSKQNPLGAGPIQPVRLDVIRNHQVVQSAEFVKDKIVLGRVLSADLRLDDPRVSRIHALIEVKGPQILVTDLASSHGTFINGTKVLEGKLQVGDTLKLGFVEVKIEKGSGKPTATESLGASDAEGTATQVEIDRDKLDKGNRRGPDRRQADVFPEEKRLDERRQGDRRVPGEEPPPLEGDRRVGERRRADRRHFDITSLERRIEERRARGSDDDILPEDLEKAFDIPEHARELELTVLWGDHILDVSNYYDEALITVGESPRNEYIIPSIGISDEFPLVNINEDGSATLAFTEKMSGTVRARDKVYDVAQLKNEKFVKIKYAIIDKLMNNVDGFIWAGLYKKNYKASDKEIGTIYGKKLFIKRDEK
jgi:pSer/pThr/pTyr-binding forkhead associated (FHA) protein